MAYHVDDCEKILTRLEEFHLTLSKVKSISGIKEVLVIRHMCGPYRHRPSMEKIDVIGKMKECTNILKV